MARHAMGPDDIILTRWAADPHVSPDGERVAWCEAALDAETDSPTSRIMVGAGSDGPPRAFSAGPSDFSPKWSPDGRHLAYLSAGDGPPVLRLAPLTGGVPATVDAPGPASAFEWSPSGDRVVMVVNMEGRSGDGDDPTKRNAPRVIRGRFNRLDGVGWRDGRQHLFVHDLTAGTTVQVSSGDYDHAQPSWSPDGTEIVFVSDRSRRRDDRIGDAEVWVMPASGGRPRRVAEGIGSPEHPLFSPDGNRVAFVAVPDVDQQAGRDQHVFVVPADGTGEPARLAPRLDRPTGFALAGRPLVWIAADELAFAVADRGTVDIRRARLDERGARVVTAGEAQVTGLAVGGPPGRPVLAYASAWVDSPAEIHRVALGTRPRPPVQVSDAGGDLRRNVDLRPLERMSVTASDGTSIEYMIIRPRPAGRGATAAPPLFLEIHGGPHLYNPLSEGLSWYQCLAGAGYLVALPNPRGSIGYGERFSHCIRGDWGGADFTDLMTCADDLVARGLADARRQYVGGYSYGGYMTALTVGRTDRFKAAVIGAPVTDLVSQFGTSDADGYFADAMAGDPWSDPTSYLERSPTTFAAKVKTPVFLHVHDGDLRCPPGQADQLFVALRWFDKEVEYVRYPGGSHLSMFTMFGPPSQSSDRVHRVVDFLARHGGPPAAEAGEDAVPASRPGRRGTRRPGQPRRRGAG